MTKLTKEQLTDDRLAVILSETQAVINERNAHCKTGGSVRVNARLFESMLAELQRSRHLLAGLEQEPVAYMYKDRLHTDARFSLHTRFGNWSQEDINEYKITEIPLYAAPQLPQPAVPDAISTRQAISKMEECEPCDSINVAYKYGWNACRAAMLQGAENAESRCTIQAAPALDSSPKIAKSCCSSSPVITDDVRRMDWLVSKTGDVREPMVYGSHSLFWSQTITDEEDEYHATKLREQIDAAMAAEQAAAPQQEAKS